VINWAALRAARFIPPAPPSSSTVYPVGKRLPAPGSGRAMERNRIFIVCAHAGFQFIERQPAAYDEPDFADRRA
jgi:hypothetical protein